MRWLVVVVAALAFAPTAYAQGATVQAVDAGDTWSPPSSPSNPIRIKVGETVTWSFAGTTRPHNVASKSSNWSFRTDFQTAGPPATYTFTTPGVYDFVCEAHPQTMTGTVAVADASGTPPPPPPPPPPSEQHWVNDQAPPTVLELVDDVPPELTRVRVDAVRNGARVRFRLSERATVHVRFLRAGVPVEAARKTFGTGPGRLTVRNRRLDGRYRVEVFARDLSGNRSAVERERVTVR
jgi:plastocyanin